MDAAEFIWASRKTGELLHRVETDKKETTKALMSELQSGDKENHS